MKTAALPSSIADYDRIGLYRQDEINGLPEQLLTRLLDCSKLEEAGSVLEAMSGNGNLASRILSYCSEKHISTPLLDLLDSSTVQCQIAREELSGLPVRVICGDVLQDIPKSYDRVLIKSGSHEIPLHRQRRLYAKIFDALHPGGLFVHLGFVFDDPEERHEFREIARVKDRLAGMQFAVRNRHFLLRAEFFDFLGDVGFADIRSCERFDYQIRSSLVALHYFSPETREEFDRVHQAAQARASALRQHGRIRFFGNESLMLVPGEITVARKPLTT